MHAGHDLRRKEHSDQTNDAANHAGLAELLPAGAADHVRGQELQSTGYETEAGQRRRDCTTSVTEVADQVQKGGYFHIREVLHNASEMLAAVAIAVRRALASTRSPASKCAEDDAHQRRGEHDGADSDQARLHRGLSHFELVRTSARCRVLQRTPHERQDADRNRDVPNGGREVAR